MNDSKINVNKSRRNNSVNPLNETSTKTQDDSSLQLQERMNSLNDSLNEEDKKPDLGNDYPGKMFTLDGEKVSEKELKLLIKVSESKEKHFKLGRCLLIMFYHFLFFCGTPMIAIPCVFIMEGFDFHLIRNMRFFNINMYFGI